MASWDPVDHSRGGRHTPSQRRATRDASGEEVSSVPAKKKAKKAKSKKSR